MSGDPFGFGLVSTGVGIGVYGVGPDFGVFSSGLLGVSTLGTGGNTALCINNQTIASCSSSLRYKKELQPFDAGLSVINQLRPIAFKWKTDNMRDVGFGAEDVAKINTRFVTYNAKGEVEGVKYDRLSVVFVNAFKEQQAQLEQQQEQIKRQQQQLAGLKKLLCRSQPQEEMCQ